MASREFEIVAISAPLNGDERYLSRRLPPMSDAAARLVATAERAGWIYFIQAGYSGSIKIGWSTNPRKRFKALQTGQSATLRLLGLLPGDKEAEALFHERFADAAIRGEWFNRNKILEPITLLLMRQGLRPFAANSRNSPEVPSLYSFNGEFTGVY